MELFRALGSLIEVPAPEHRAIAAALGLPRVPHPAEHAAVVAFQRYPYASVYLGGEGMLGGEARDRIAGFRRALGIGDDKDPANEADHLASLLALLSALEHWREREPDPARAALLAEARATLAWEHLAPWTGPYLASFAGCGSPFYEAWAELVGEALARLAAEAALPGYLPVALRDAPELADPRTDGGAAFVASLLAPVRSGMIVLRDDLVRLGREAGLACRAGERRYVLEAFLAQDAGATLQWLAGHARDWGGRMARRGPALIARWWADRAGKSAALLSRLADGAGVAKGARGGSGGEGVAGGAGGVLGARVAPGAGVAP